MRWIEHIGIGNECLGRKSLPYTLGLVLPDWFERNKKHVWYVKLENISKRLYLIKTMKDSNLRDYYLGTIIHYICDFCCTAHNHNYTNYVRHLVYEFISQKYYVSSNLERVLYIKHDITQSKYINYINKIKNAKSFYSFDFFFQRFIIRFLIRNHAKKSKYYSKYWYLDKRLIKLDIISAYELASLVIYLVEN